MRLSFPVMPPQMPRRARSENWSDQSAHCCATVHSLHIALAIWTFCFVAPLSGKNTSTGVFRQLALFLHLASFGSYGIADIGRLSGLRWFINSIC